jgi:hypothetical protein
VWADCLHYYGRDLYEMDGASAMKLAERVRDVVDVYPLSTDEDGNTNPPKFRSSLFAAVDRDTKDLEADETLHVQSAESLAAELARMDPSGTVEVVSV